jgi:NAD(P)-dependent dehydrogenase (short-subunit alcohol dehydrogenase family)
MRYANRVAIITGAARGIGKAIATRLSVEGATVVIADVNRQAAEVTAKELEAAGRKVMVSIVDVSDPAEVTAMVQAVLQRFARIDILVNNAAILGDVIPIREMPDVEWHRVMAVNLHGVFHCSRAVLPAMLSRKYGRIVNLASVAGKEGNANMAAYSVSKAGVIGLTKSLAKEHAQDGITVNCVTPALTDTDMIKAYSPEQRALLASKVPIGRLATPSEIAAIVCFLASDDASFVTGAVYDVSGGRSDY